MNGRTRLMLGLAGLNGFLAVAAGAFSQHGVADPAVQMLLKTASEYGMIHALAVFAAFAVMRADLRWAEAAGWLFLAGGVLFAGSLEAMALTGQHLLAMATPFGGLLMMAGWLALAAAGLSGVRTPKG